MSRRNATAVLVLVACASVAVSWCRAHQAEDLSEQLQSLRQERYDTLRTLTNAVATRHGEGTTDALHLFNARHRLLQAKADLVTTSEEKVKCHEEIVANLAEKELLLAKRHKAGAGAMLEDALGAKAERLLAEIRLLEVKTAVQ